MPLNYKGWSISVVGINGTNVLVSFVGQKLCEAADEVIDCLRLLLFLLIRYDSLQLTHGDADFSILFWWRVLILPARYRT